MNINQILEERNVPELMKLNRGKKVKCAADFEKRREEIKKMLQEEEYGYIPAPPDKLTVEADQLPNFCAGKAIRRNLKFTVTIGEKSFTFPVVSVIPNSDKPVPAFVHINFTPDSPDKYLPTEEIIDNGFAVFSFGYTNVTSDNGNFKTGIAPIFRHGRIKQNAPGKIAIWAWAAMRVMDYIQTLDSIDKDNVAIVGHSRLGKTALVCGAYDDRFKYVISNDSGCSGAAITRGKQGETPEVITRVFPFWFCPRYVKKAKEFDSGKFDQHFLLALSAPRVVMIGSAEEDLWADPESEFLSVAAASEAWKLLGRRGLVYGDEIPTAKCVLDEGDVFYHVRRGTHYFSREDWAVYMSNIRKCMDEDR